MTSLLIPALLLSTAILTNIDAPVPATPPTTDIKAYLVSLETDTTITGRQSVAALKVPGVDTLPTGASLSGAVINVTGTGVTFTDWALDGFNIDVQSGGVVELITECTSDISIAGFWVINVRTGGRCKEVSYITFDGGDVLNAGVCIQGQAGHGVEHIHHNRFLNCSNDAIKPTGSAYGEQLIEHNFFGPPKAWPNAKAAWLSGTTYAKDEVAMNAAGTQAYVSKAGGNIGNAVTNTTYWSAASPHADAMQWIGDTIGGVRVRWNTILWRASDYNGGVTAAIYPDPPGTSSMTDINYVYENIIDTTSTSSTAAFPRPFIVGANDTPWAVPRFYNNWLEERSGYIIMGGTTVKTTNWGVNWQLSNDAVIAFDDSRLPSTDLVDWTSSTPALGADWT